MGSIEAFTHRIDFVIDNSESEASDSSTDCEVETDITDDWENCDDE